MKNKGLLIGAVIIIILAAFGGYMFLNKSQGIPSSGTENDTGNVFTSIQDALSKSVSLKCDFTDESGRKTVAYVKNGAVRADIASPNANESGSVIVKDKKIYFWNAQGGFMMEVPETTPEEGAAKPETMQGQDIVGSLEQYKDSCNAAIVSDSLFTPPSDVDFQDFSKMMERTMPTGTGSGSKNQPTIDSKQYEDLMKQYSAPQ